eukprot:jgi/Mesvir1/26716/Mv20493-RA.1
MTGVREERCVTFSSEFAERNRRAEARWCAMKARSHCRHAKRLIYDHTGSCRPCVVRAETKKVSLTEEEKETLREFESKGVEALKDSRVFTDWMESEPRHGWVMCSFCGIPMPAGKVEECIPMSHTLFKRRVPFSLPAIFCGIVASIGVIKVAPVYYPKWFEDKKTGQVSKVRIHMAGILAGLIAWGGVQLAINFRR